MASGLPLAENTQGDPFRAIFKKTQEKLKKGLDFFKRIRYNIKVADK